MDFSLTKDQEKLVEEVSFFAKKEVKPGTVERDREEDFETLFKLLTGKMAEKGWMGLSYPLKYGGMGKGFQELVLLLTELARVDVSLAASYSVCMTLGPYSIYKFGTEEQKEKFLPPLFKGLKISAFAMTEENAGSDSAMQETLAVKEGNHYILNGRKIYITNAGYADTYTVIAMTDKDKGNKGISAFIVEKGTPGFSFGKEYKKMGIRSTVQRELIFQDCHIPAENLLGNEGDGFKIAMTTIDTGRLGVACQALGASMGAYDIALSHSKERIQFGKPVCSNQGVSFLLADMAMKIETAKLITQKAAWLLDLGLPYSKEVAMAKTLASDYAMEITTDAVQILGGKGFLVESEAERFMRDVKILQIYEGTNEIQRLVISSHILR